MGKGAKTGHSLVSTALGMQLLIQISFSFLFILECLRVVYSCSIWCVIIVFATIKSKWHYKLVTKETQSLTFNTIIRWRCSVAADAWLNILASLEENYILFHTAFFFCSLCQLVFSFLKGKGEQEWGTLQQCVLDQWTKVKFVCEWKMSIVKYCFINFLNSLCIYMFFKRSLFSSCRKFAVDDRSSSRRIDMI